LEKENDLKAMRNSRLRAQESRKGKREEGNGRSEGGKEMKEFQEQGWWQGRAVHQNNKQYYKIKQLRKYSWLEMTGRDRTGEVKDRGGKEFQRTTFKGSGGHHL
jgi:hypothetical protein